MLTVMKEVVQMLILKREETSLETGQGALLFVFFPPIKLHKPECRWWTQGEWTP